MQAFSFKSSVISQSTNHVLKLFAGVEVANEPVALGDDAILTCKVSGPIEADFVFWTKNGEPVFNDKRYTNFTFELMDFSRLSLLNH